MRGLALVLLLLLPACGRSAADAPPVELTAASSYGRHAAVQGKVDLYVANTGAAPVEVQAYQVRHPMFEVVPPMERSSTFEPGAGELIVPVPFGRPRCEVADAAGAEVALRVRTGDQVSEVVVPLPDREPGLLRAHRLACAAAAVEAVAQASLGPRWEREGEALRTTLRLDRRGSGAVVLSEVLGSILFTVDAPVLRLAADADSAQVPVVLQAGRCDRHAMIESKTSFTFPYLAAVDGGEPARLALTADPTGRAALQALLDDTCGAGE